MQGTSTNDIKGALIVRFPPSIDRLDFLVNNGLMNGKLIDDWNKKIGWTIDFFINPSIRVEKIGNSSRNISLEVVTS